MALALPRSAVADPDTLGLEIAVEMFGAAFAASSATLNLSWPPGPRLAHSGIITTIAPQVRGCRPELIQG